MIQGLQTHVQRSRWAFSELRKTWIPFLLLAYSSLPSTYSHPWGPVSIAACIKTLAILVDGGLAVVIDGVKI